MLAQLTIRNFKQFDEVTIPLGNPVVFVGPNNSGKTSALQALALWNLGVRTWLAKRGERSKAKERTGAAINRHDLVYLPLPHTALMWREKRLRRVTSRAGKATDSILVEIEVGGVTRDREWRCPMEFDYGNEEIIRCRPGRLEGTGPGRASIPGDAAEVGVAFLPPMSGLASNERRIDDGAIEVSLGEGQTAQVLRNLCWKLWEAEHAKPEEGEWGSLQKQMIRLFGAAIHAPEYVAARGEIQMSYGEKTATGERKDLDMVSAGRGFHQTLLTLAFLRWKPKSVLLIDEPDAHLEILRQKQIYAELAETARRLGSQLVIATHSEVVMNEAESDTLVAFVGRPHALRHSDQVRKSLALLGYEQFLQAETTGWVLYLEGDTDLKALRALARVSGHPAADALARPFAQYVLNQPHKARAHFFGLREAYPQLGGMAVFDNSPDVALAEGTPLLEVKWRRRELENYFCQPAVLRRWVEVRHEAGDLLSLPARDHERRAMEKAITENTAPAALADPAHSFWVRMKASDDYLPAVFGSFFAELRLPNRMNKSDYAELAALLRPEEVDAEILDVLEKIQAVHLRASQRAER